MILSTWRVGFLHGLLLALCGCTDPGGEGTPDSTSSTSTQSGGTESGGSETSGVPADMGDTTGSEPACGDGVLDPGEACDDGNQAAGDGCTPTCEIGPCGFEWVSRELVLTTSNFEVSTPLVLDEDTLVSAHQLGAEAENLGLLRSSTLDGSPMTSETLELDGDSPVPHALALADDGALFLATLDPLASQTTVRRVEPGETSATWIRSQPSEHQIVDLRVAQGQLVVLDTVDDGPMNQDVALFALDPANGEPLWIHQFGGPPAANGFSTDRGAALDVDASGRVFVAYDEYRAWDTLVPVVVAFGPGGAAEPLWSTTVHELEGRQLEISDLALGPDGILALSFIRWQGSQVFWVAALDAETGELLWRVERDDFELPNQLSTIRGVTVLDDRVLAVGTWVTDEGGVELRQGFVLGLGLDGGLVCIGTSDDSEPGRVGSSETHLPLSIIPRPRGGAYASGYVNDFGANRVDLWLARIR